MKSGEEPALLPDDNAKYAAEFVVDLDQIVEPMIADPDVNNDDVSKQYTHDTIRPVSYYGGNKTVDLGFVGSCMVHKGDMKIISQMLKNLEKQHGTVSSRLHWLLRLRRTTSWMSLRQRATGKFLKYSGSSLTTTRRVWLAHPTRTSCILSVLAVTSVWVTRKRLRRVTVMATSTRLFQGRVVADSEEKKGESLLASTPVVVLSTILGRTPTIEEYTAAVDGIKLTDYEPPAQDASAGGLPVFGDPVINESFKGAAFGGPFFLVG